MRDSDPESDGEKSRIRMLDWAMFNGLIGADGSRRVAIICSLDCPNTIERLGIDTEELRPVFRQQRKDGCDPFVAGSLPLGSATELLSDLGQGSGFAEWASRPGLPVIVLGGGGASLVTIAETSDPTERQLLEEVIDDSGAGAGPAPIDPASPAWRKLSARWQARSN